MDKLVHASIVDAALGAVSDRKHIRVFRHNDLSSLEKRLQSAREKTKGGVLILTEGVYGMTGDLARLDGISALKDRYGARLFVDDAHGVGVMGPNGRGTAEYFGVQDRIDLYFGTFAKAFASIGGYTAAKEEVVEWIRYNARTQVFAKSLPMLYVKALQKTLELVRSGRERRERLFDISNKLSTGLRELGYYIGDVKSPLVPVFIPEGSAATAMEWITYLRNKGIFVTGVTYPVIPKNYIMFRMVPTASHTDEDVARTIEAFKSLRDDRNIPLNYDIAAISTIYGDAE
jgi:glycine C-acetyltransferase